MSFPSLLNQKRQIQRNNFEDFEDFDESSLPKINYDSFNMNELQNILEIEEKNSWNIPKTKPNYNQIEFKLTLKEQSNLKRKIFEQPKKRENILSKLIIDDSELSKNTKEKNELEYKLHLFKTFNYTLQQIKNINTEKNIPLKKINLILDIDLTMINATESATEKDLKFKKKDTDILISGKSYNDNPYQFLFRFRPGLFEFINNIKNYCNFYISSLGHINYVNDILSYFKQKSGISINQENIIASPGVPKIYKRLEELININLDSELNNTIIFDDEISVWVKQDLSKLKKEKDILQSVKSLLLSKKYYPEIHDFNNIVKYNILLRDNKNNYIQEVDYVIGVETDQDYEKNKKNQLFYIEKFILKCIKLSWFTGMSIVNAMEYYRKQIFKDCCFCFKFISDTVMTKIYGIIQELGGTVSVKQNEVTHYVIDQVVNKDQLTQKNINKKFITPKYIYECYFNMTRMNENEKQFNGIR